MTLWKILTPLGLVAGLAVLYVFQPMVLQLGVPHLQCWWQGGVYLRSTEKERGYHKLMLSTPANTQRLANGEALGCFPEGPCAPNAAEANTALEHKMMAWVAQGGTQLLAGNVLGMIGNTAEATARAKQAEAEYCLKYLGNIRRALPQSSDIVQ